MASADPLTLKLYAGSVYASKARTTHVDVSTLTAVSVLVQSQAEQSLRAIVIPAPTKQVAEILLSAYALSEFPEADGWVTREQVLIEISQYSLDLVGQPLSAMLTSQKETP